jgi:hypothetical protein
MNIDDPSDARLTGPSHDPSDDPLTGLLIGQAGIRRLRGKVRWEGNLDESRLGRPFEQHQKVIHP